MNLNARSVETPLNLSAFGTQAKIKGPALPAAMKKAKNYYPRFHLFPPVPVHVWIWEAAQTHHRAHLRAVFREADLYSRALY